LFEEVCIMQNSVNESPSIINDRSLISYGTHMKRNRKPTKTTAQRKQEKSDSEFHALKTGVLNSDLINRLWRMHY
tara:strand:- start:1080 stop:1304 length:225 start_codon:yes stop_codon:yes gene_type:complete